MLDIKRSKAICVLGAHRSGTSTITRGLNLLGAWLGEGKDLMRPLPENPEGFWERLDIYYLQNMMLSSMKRSWDSTAPLPENWYQSDDILQLKSELSELVRREFAGHQVWLWKDPRTCLLLPLWKDVLAGLGIDLKVVFVVRNPLDVATSLNKRNDFSMAKGFGIWLNHTLTALKEAADLDTVFLSYDHFLDDWENELKRCADALGLDWVAGRATVTAEMKSFVRRDLRHSISSVEEIHCLNVPEPVVRLYGVLLAVLKTGILSADAKLSINAMYLEFFDYAKLFEFDMDKLADYRVILESSADSPKASPIVAELEKELDARTQWAWKLDEDLKNARKQLSSLQNSLSWKITSPFRLAHQIVEKLRQG